MKRQLLLQANGIEVNPHLHLPLSDFLQNPINTIGTLRELWRMPIGMSSAFIDESALGKLPSARFPVTGNKQGIVDEVNKYQQAVSELKKVRSHEDDQVIFYPMVWQNPKKIVGITILVERDFRLGRREDRYGESWIIEFQHGKRPRDILPGSEGFAKVRFQTVKQVKGDIWEPTGKMSIEMFGIDEDPTTRSEEQTVLWSAIQTMLRKVESKSFRIGVNAIRKYTDKEFVAIEFAYNHQTGEILAIDF